MERTTQVFGVFCLFLLVNLSLGKELKVSKKIVSANNRFACQLLSELVKREEDKNIFLSPTSISFALAMTYNGAEGETKSAMAKTLNLQELELQELNEGFFALKNLLTQPDPKVELRIANSLWARREIDFRRDFLKRNKRYFSAWIQRLNFTDPKSPRIINDWVAKETKGKIKGIVDEIKNDMVLFLINAIYFKGKWQKEFDKKATKEGFFHLLSGDKKRVSFMNQSNRFPYLKGENFSAISLAYGKGRMCMDIFLPQDIREFLNNLSFENLATWFKSFQEMEGDISLPRFKLEDERSLRDALAGLGMAIAFLPGKADFRKMREKGELFINDVKHKTFLEVNEEGTEATAVTSVEIALTAVPERFSMVIDRPFFFTIRDRETGLILFVGVITEPKEW